MDSVAGTKGDYAAITREEPATNLLPSAKFKRHIVAALNSDDLYFRTPRLNADSFSGTTRETSYLSRGDSISLGAIHFVKNGRFKFYSDLRAGVAIVKPQVLFAYKEDGRSNPMQHDLEKTGQITHHARLLDSSDVHAIKHREDFTLLQSLSRMDIRAPSFEWALFAQDVQRGFGVLPVKTRS